jgi:sulfur relay (sulfurtransferase) DsrC/TusE family protein
LLDFLNGTYGENIVRVSDLDDEGYLIDPNSLNEELASKFVNQENVRFAEDHWDEIQFMHSITQNIAFPRMIVMCRNILPND